MFDISVLCRSTKYNFISYFWCSNLFGIRVNNTLLPNAHFLPSTARWLFALFIYLLRIRVRAYPRAKKWCEQLNDKIIFKHCNFLQKNVSSSFFQYLEKLKEFDGVSKIQMTCSMRLMNHFIRDLSWRLKPMILILIDF